MQWWVHGVNLSDQVNHIYQNGECLSTLIWPQIFVFIFSLTFLHLPLLTYIWPYLSLVTLMWSCLSLIALIWPYVPNLPYIYSYYSNETAPLCNILEQSNNYSWIYCISRNWVTSRMQFGCLSSHWQFVVCTFWYFTHISNFKAIGHLVMGILHLNDLGDTESVVTNAVWALI